MHALWRVDMPLIQESVGPLCTINGTTLIRNFGTIGYLLSTEAGGVGHDHVQVVFADSAIISPIDFVWDSWTCHLIPL